MHGFYLVQYILTERDINTTDIFPQLFHRGRSDDVRRCEGLLIDEGEGHLRHIEPVVFGYGKVTGSRFLAILTIVPGKLLELINAVARLILFTVVLARQQPESHRRVGKQPGLFTHGYF